MKHKIAYPNKNNAECQCSVCDAMTETGLKIYRVSWTDEDVIDYSYLGINRTRAEFLAAIKDAKSQIDDKAFTGTEICQFFHKIMSEHDFIAVWDYEAECVYVESKPPEVKGYSLSVDEEEYDEDPDEATA